MSLLLDDRLFHLGFHHHCYLYSCGSFEKILVIWYTVCSHSFYQSGQFFKLDRL